MQHTGARPISLLGDVVTDDGSVLRQRYVRLVDGRIASIDTARSGRVDYTLADDELIFPSFLDLHTHCAYNLLPLWHSPFWAWDNRFQWRGNASYKTTIGAAVRAIVARSGEGSAAYTAFTAVSELMALAGGTTMLQENASLDSAGFARQPHVLIRNTGSSLSMGLGESDQIVSVLDLYEPEPYSAPRDPYQDTSAWRVKPASARWGGSSYLSAFALSVSGLRTRGTIVHLAEGRSGFLQSIMGPDAYTRAEFEAFKNFITSGYRGEDVEMVREARPILIHACGMNTIADAGTRTKGGAGSGSSSSMRDTLGFLKTYGIGVIWSPVSNLLLYQDTTNVLPLLDAGIPVALGTDWTPSGSKTVWEEAKFAADFLEARGWKGNINLTCFRAITTVPADLLGVPLGRVRAGNFADLIVLRRPRGAKRGDPLLAFREGGDAEVRVVFVGGVPMYGDRDVLKALGAAARPLPDEHPGSRKSDGARVADHKGFVLPAGCGVTADDLQRALEAADVVVGRSRPEILAADDDDYSSRIEELREWVHNFGPKSPRPKPAPPPPSGLAPGELEWMYTPSLNPADRLPPEVVDLLGRIAPCRDERCIVPRKHPYYHAQVLTEAGDSYGFRVPCMPVVPVLTNRQQLFIMGDYPTAKFTARSTNALPVITGSADAIDAANQSLEALLDVAGQQPHPGHPSRLLETYVEEIDDLVRGACARPDRVSGARAHASDTTAFTPERKNEFFVPVADVFAPMQDASYFDGYKVRNVAAGVFLEENYLAPVGVNTATQAWLTNMIKCYLFHPENVASYQALGWTDVHVEASYSDLLPVGRVCSQWINEEVQVCDPKLVLTVGKPPCVLLHNVPLEDAALQARVYEALLGVRLPANDARLEDAIAKALKLESKYPPPFPSGSRVAAVLRRVSGADVNGRQPVSIARFGPWARYNVFHMMHPQAVMMAQTTLSTTLLTAIQLALGPKSAGMSVGELTDALAKYLRTHRTTELIKALPYGQRDTFNAAAQLLERHAVTLASFADTLSELKLIAGDLRGAQVLAQQAQLLANTYRLADSPEAELKRLQETRDKQRLQIARYLRGS